MRIQSNFKDYYDVAQKFGHDEDFVYNRYTQKIEIPGWIGFELSDNVKGATYESFFIGFCGRIYPVLRAEIYQKPLPDQPTPKAHVKICYKVEDVNRFIDEHTEQEARKEYYHTRIHSSKDWFIKTSSPLTIEEWFKGSSKLQESLMGNFEKYYAPLFTVEMINPTGKIKSDYRHNTMISVNGCLSKFDFARKFEPFTAFQEISMFLGSMATPQKPIPIHSDEMKAEINGFDNKYSFRKDPIRKREGRK